MKAAQACLPLVAFVVVICALSGEVRGECDEGVENRTKVFLNEFNEVVRNRSYHYSLASWAYNTNITDENLQRTLKQGEMYEEVVSKKAEEGSQFDLDELCSNQTKKTLAYVLGYRKSQYDTEETKKIRSRISEITATMEAKYSSAKACLRKEDCLALEPGLAQLLRSSRNEPDLRATWKMWRDVSGKQIKKLFLEHTELNEKLLKLKNSSFHDRGKSWVAGYETGEGDGFVKDVEALLDQVMPLYKQIHTFVRRKLRGMYRVYDFPDSRLLPAHMLGNMWAHWWDSIYKDVMPFPRQQSVDITEELTEQNYDVPRMFHVAEDFFTSLGLIKMTDDFWNNSMLTKPTDGRDVVCHASAWDFSHGQDFRIKMCTSINQEDFITIHHEMGHIEYDLQYKNQPYVFQGGANPGFHEAVGDTLALSVGTTKHLKTIGLLDKNAEENNKTDINFLMSMALQKIVFLPYAYILDKWRWDVFSGEVKQYNDHWWKLRCKYQGLVPPVDRDENDFDPASKYHVASDVSYIRYFVAHILQFQFYEALCNATNHKGPLYKCDFYNNTVAGDKLSEMLQLGSSKPWPDALEKITGSRKMDMGSMMRYFQPLIDYLSEANKGHQVGWDDTCHKPSRAPRGPDGGNVVCPVCNKTAPVPVVCPGRDKTKPVTSKRPTTTTPASASGWKAATGVVVLGVLLPRLVSCLF